MPADEPIDLRIATPAELEALVGLALAFRDHLGQQSPGTADLRDALARLLDDAATDFVLAWAAAAPVGYVQCRYRYSAWSGGLDVEFEDVFVVAAARRRGLGRRIVEFAIAHARDRGCRLACLATNERNLPALTLYGGLGFSAARSRWSGGRQLWLERPLGEL